MKLDKMIRRARRLYAKASDDTQTEEVRKVAQSRANAVEQELASLMYDPHAVSNAEIDVKRLTGLMFRKSTTPDNMQKRSDRKNEAERRLQATMLAATKIEMEARDLLDKMMGRGEEAEVQPHVEPGEAFTEST